MSTDQEAPRVTLISGTGSANTSAAQAGVYSFALSQPNAPQGHQPLNVPIAELPHFGGVALASDAVYLDYAAATPIADAVLSDFVAWSAACYANPSSRLHGPGEYADHGLMDARRRVAACLGAHHEQVIFTSSATEANNLALRGLVMHPKRKRRRIVFSPTSHSSVIATIEALVRSQLKSPIEAIPLQVGSDGQIDCTHAAAVINQETLCVSLIDVNNETGVLETRIPELLTIAHRAGALVHVDAVQGFARYGFDAAQNQADLFTVSSGKIYGPRGAACLVLAKPASDRLALRLSPQLTGGGQESGLRSSTPNLAALQAFARACELVCQYRSSYAVQMQELEELFLAQLRSRCRNTVIVHGGKTRVPGLMSLAIENTNAMKLVEQARPLCVSVGSACRTLQATASPVLLSMGIPLEQALASIRLSFGVPNTADDVTRAAEILARAAALV